MNGNQLLAFGEGMTFASTNNLPAINRRGIKQAKLLEAHYADAVPLALMKSEQEKLNIKLASIETRISAHRQDSRHASEALNAALSLLDDCGTAYRNAKDGVRRVFNQAIFEKIFVYPDGTIMPEYTEPFTGIVSPLQKALLAATGEDTPSGSLLFTTNAAVSIKISPWHFLLEQLSGLFDSCSSKELLVEVTRFELAASSSRTKRATKLRHTSTRARVFYYILASRVYISIFLYFSTFTPAGL